jgi:hypothetical protein
MTPTNREMKMSLTCAQQKLVACFRIQRKRPFKRQQNMSVRITLLVSPSDTQSD